MRYGLVETGDTIKKGDEIYSPNLKQWFPIDADAYTYHPCEYPVRRLINQPKPIELFTIPCGPWVGCTGSVFMDGDQKKVRLQNVFVGGERHVIDFPRRERYDNKHFILEDDEVIKSGDIFIMDDGSSDTCEGSIGFSVADAKKQWPGVVEIVIRKF